MSSDIQFIAARVAHARLRPKRNSFRYGVPYLAIPARALEAKARAGVLSIDGANLFSVRTRDYGDGRSAPVAWIKDILAQWNLGEADGEIVLVTIPRVLGFSFNPVSFWLCFDRASGLRAVVAEVNNTFGERHFYVCCRDDHGSIGARDELTARKVFHVSPFMKVEGHYRFAFAWSGDGLGVRIDLHDDAGLILTTSVAGKREPLTSWRLVRALLGNPLLMFKVTALIHYQAVKLALKGVAAFRKPAPPAASVSR